MGKLDNWMASGAYLPPMMRDFHDQKDVFRCIDEMLENYQSKTPDHLGAVKHISWIDLHMVTVDVFLWWMAKRGYTLQRCRAKLPFADIDDDIARYKKRMQAVFAEAINPTVQP